MTLAHIMTSLRTMWGTSLHKITTDFGKVFLAETLKNSSSFIEKKWLVNQEDHLVLTTEGKLFADHIAGGLFLIADDYR